MLHAICGTSDAYNEGTAEMFLDAADKAAISMVKDHPKNSHRHELKLHTLSAKAERLL